MQDLKIAFVGCGHIAHVHQRYLGRYGKEVNVVCDASELRAREFASKYGIKHIETDINDLLINHQPDVVHILVPPHLHFPLVSQCLKGGCHVLVEKPVCELSDEFNELTELAKEAGKLLCVDHTRVYNPMLVKVRQQIENGKFGKVIRMEYHYDDPSLQKTEDDTIPVSYVKGAPAWFQKLRGGVVADLIPHPVSVMLSIDPSMKLANVYGKATDGIIEEIIARVHSQTADGLIILSLNSRPLKNELRIFCERGIISIDFRNLYHVVIPQRGVPNIVARVMDTISSTFQTLFRFLISITLLILGRKHPYDGLDKIIELFYSKIDKQDFQPVPLIHADKVTEISQGIIEKIVKPGKFATDIDAALTQKYSKRTEAPAKILVTGGTGFIGSNLVTELMQQDDPVRVLCRSARSARKLPDNVALAFGDMRNPQLVGAAMEGIDTVYHCAAAMSGDWAEFYTSTVDGTRILLEAVADKKVKRLIYVSSLGVMDYARLGSGEQLTEASKVEQFPHRRGFYTKAKKEAEDLVWQFQKDNPDIDVILVRPGLVYGRESNNNLKNAGVLLGNKLVCFGLGGRCFGLSYVKNLARTLAQLATVSVPISEQNLVHVTDDEQPTVKQYLALHNQHAEHRVGVIYVPVIIWRTAFKVIDILLTLVRKKNPDYSYRFNSNAKKVQYATPVLDEHPELKGKITLDQALTETLDGK